MADVHRVAACAPPCREQEGFGSPYPEFVESRARVIGVLHSFPGIRSGVNPVWSTERAVSLARGGGVQFRPDAVAKSAVRMHGLPEEATLLGCEKPRAKGEEYGLAPLGVVDTGSGHPTLVSMKSTTLHRIVELFVYILYAALRKG